MKKIVKYKIFDLNGSGIDRCKRYDSLKKLIHAIKNKIDRDEYNFEISMCFLDPNDRDELTVYTHRPMFIFVNSMRCDVYKQRQFKNVKEVYRVMRKLSPIIESYGVKK